MLRRTASLGLLTAALVLVAGCSGGGDRVTSVGTLAEPADQPQSATTYDPEMAPVGASMQLETVRGDESTTANLSVQGMVPNRGYAAHLHTERCGPDGDDAGPHFQHELDPAATPDVPSVDPAFANAENEIWLDFRTDDTGAATMSTTVPFALDDERAPRSLIVHEEEVTATAPGEAGTAGGRVACLVVET